MAHSTPPDPDRDEVADLLHLAGPREMPPALSSDRIRNATREAWREAVAVRRSRRLAWGGAALATAAAVVLAVYRTTIVEWLDVSQPVAAVGLVEGVVGDATIGRPRSASDVERLVSGRPVLTGSRIRTGMDGYLNLRLASGVSLRVDVGTELALASASVVMLERGAVYIDTDDARQPAGVEVRTPLATARDVGTRFEVRLLDAGMRVRVRNGLVRLEHRGASYDAAPGVELTASAGILQRRVIALHGPEWDWTLRVSPRFALEGRTLGSFLQWVEREGGMRPHFADPALERSSSSIVLHGSVDGMTPAEALGIVLPTCGLSHRIDGDLVRIDRQ